MARRISLALASILGVYLVFAALRGIDLLKSDDPAVKALGISVLILPLIGTVLVFREIRFGRLSYQMGQLIDISYLPTNGMSDEQKQANLDSAIAKAKTEMSSWQAWYSVALAYDLVSERKLAREAMQYSVELYQAAKPK